MKRGNWKLELTGVDQLNDIDKEHIADLITEGFTEGEVIQDESNEELIEKARKGVVLVSPDSIIILERSSYYRDLTSWVNPKRCGLLDKYVATLNPNITKLPATFRGR